MRDNVVLLNFSRNGIIDDEAVSKALDEGKVYAYVCDFPSNLLKNRPRAITLPHLGASTKEAEDNCAVMVADEVRDYLENGNIRNSVNFPKVYMKRYQGYRLCVANANVPNMLGQISTTLAGAGLNIVDMINKSRGDLAYTLVDVDSKIDQTCIDKIASTEGVLAVRVID
jgi:D-3-phosphoglycerate dehydrogenase